MPETMRAVGYRRCLPIDDPSSLEDITLPVPAPGPHDLLVEVKAVSVNPVDVKVRARIQPDGGHKVLGYDAAGIVRAVGPAVTRFRPGDAVFYAGDITRPGTNAAFHRVDERIAGPKPGTLSFAEAAALPLTAITAWELLFDCFRLTEGGHDGETLLVIGGAGGVGSILIQLAKQLTALTLVATASRPDSAAWVRSMGADHVIDHRRVMAPQLAALGLQPGLVAALTGSDRHFPDIVDLIAPRGQIGLIDDPPSLEIGLIKPKSLSFHWEFMFARPMFATADVEVQHRLLARVAALVDAGRLRSTATHDGGPISAATLRAAHRRQESGQAIGKTVLTWP